MSWIWNRIVALKIYDCNTCFDYIYIDTPKCIMFATFETSQHHTFVNCNYMVNNITKQTIWIGFLLLGHVVFMCSHILNVGNSTAVLPMHPNYHKAWSEGFIRQGKRPIASCLAGLTVHAMIPYIETNNRRWARPPMNLDLEPKHSGWALLWVCVRWTRVQDVCSTF